MNKVHIEKKNRDAVDEASRTLRQRLLGYEGRDLRAAEASTLTGLPLDMAEAALLKLHSAYPSKFTLGNDGGFVFRFSSLSQRREGGGLRRFWANFRRRNLPRLIAIQHGIEDHLIFLLMPAMLMVLTANMLGLAVPLSRDFPGAGCVRFFPGMVIALVIGLVGLFSILAFLFILLLLGGLIMLAVGGILILLGFYLGLWEQEAGQAVISLITGIISFMWGWNNASDAFGLIRSMSDRKGGTAIFRDAWLELRDFVFGARSGPRMESGDELKDERQLTELLVQKKGLVTARDLVTLFGWDLSQADAELSRILLDYGGDIEVTEEGHLVYVFPSWGNGVDVDRTETFAPFWEKPRESPRYWAVPSQGKGIIIALLLAGFLGLCTSQVMYAPRDFFFPRYTTEKDLLAGLGIWPYLFIAVVMGLRGLVWWMRRRRHQQHTKRLMAVKNVLAQAETGGWYVDTKFASDFGGELDELQGTKDGAYFFRFPALQKHSG